MKNICKGYLKMWRRLPGRKNFLTAKSAMHDNLAASIIVMKQYLSGDFGGIDVETVLREWEKNIVFGRSKNIYQKKEKLFASARSSGVLVQIEGKEPPGSVEMMYLCYAGMSE